MRTLTTDCENVRPFPDLEINFDFTVLIMASIRLLIGRRLSKLSFAQLENPLKLLKTPLISQFNYAVCKVNFANLA